MKSHVKKKVASGVVNPWSITVTVAHDERPYKSIRIRRPNREYAHVATYFGL